MVAFLIANLTLLVVGGGVLFAVAGFAFRRRKRLLNDKGRDLAYDGFNGATVVTLAVVPVLVCNVDHPGALTALKEQTVTIMLFALLGAARFVLEFLHELSIAEAENA